MTEQAQPQAAGMVLLQLTLGRFGNSRLGSLADVETEADKSMLRLSKVLLDSLQLAAIVQLDGQILKWIGMRSVPSYFKTGIYQVKPGAVPEIDERLKEFRAAREAAIEGFIAAYPAQAEAAAARLKDQYRAGDYPSVGAVRRKFSMSWKYMQVSAPGALRGVDPELFAEAQRKLDADMDSARQMGMALVRQQIKEMVDHLVERLEPGEDGKRKTFKNASIENLREFVTTFPFKDVANDTELQAEVRRLGGLLSGVDAKVLRSDETLREAVTRSFVDMKGRLEGLVEAAPMRQVQWEEDVA